METDSEEREAPKDVSTISLVTHPSDDYEEELVELVKLVDPLRDVAMIMKGPTWFRDTLRDAKKHAYTSGAFKESKRPNIFSS